MVMVEHAVIVAIRSHKIKMKKMRNRKEVREENQPGHPLKVIEWYALIFNK